MKRTPREPERLEHPALDTFERVLGHGVIVDRGLPEHADLLRFGVPLADVFGIEAVISSQPVSEPSDDGDEDD
jgi:hypothetical protein